MILATLLAVAPLVAQNPIDATLPNTFLPPAQQGSGNSGNRGTSASDDFNRADNPNMGPDWSEDTGDIEILSNQGHGVVNRSLMVHTSAAAPYDTSSMSSTFDTTGGLVYVAMVAGYADLSNNVFVKVQDNNVDGLYDRVFFYFGNNGGAWNGASYYFDLATPTTSGTMHLSFSGGGDVAELVIDNDTSGSSETFSSDGLLAFAGSLGTGFGVGTYGGCYFDDWSVNKSAFSLSATGSPGSTMTFDVTGATPNGPVAYLYASGLGSYARMNPFTGNLVTTGLSATGFTVAFVLNADSAGNYSLRASVPPGAAGSIFVQAVDGLSDSVSNVIAL
jgi:hypothetical protein